jgi:hypothetical protein
VTGSGNGCEKQAQGLRLLARMIAVLHLKQQMALPRADGPACKQAEGEMVDTNPEEDSQ